MQYAATAQKVADYLNYTPPEHSSGKPFWSHTLADGEWVPLDNQSGTEWQWKLHPQVIAALQQMGETVF